MDTQEDRLRSAGNVHELREPIRMQVFPVRSPWRTFLWALAGGAAVVGVALLAWPAKAHMADLQISAREMVHRHVNVLWRRGYVEFVAKGNRGEWGKVVVLRRLEARA